MGWGWASITRDDPRWAVLWSLGAAVFYGAVSVGITMFNKAVLSVYGFSFPNVLLLFQFVVTILLINGLHGLGLIVCPSFNVRTAWKIVPMSLCFLLNVGVALMALNGLDVPMYNTLKRLTTLVTLVMERLILQKVSSRAVHQAVLVIGGGAVIAGLGDLKLNVSAYVMAGVSCVLQGGYLVLLKKAEAETKLDAFGLLYYNCILNLPVVLVVVWTTSEGMNAATFSGFDDRGFLLCFVGALILGALLTYSIFLCTTVNSALTTTIVGQLKMVVSSVMGFFLFSDTPITMLHMLGVSMNSVGGIWYALIKFKERDETKKGTFALSR